MGSAASPVLGDVKLQLHPDVEVRIAALVAAATIDHGTIGMLLSHARDCERYLLTGERP